MLSTEGNDIYNENYETLNKEIKELEDEKNPRSCIRRINCVKMAILLK
jgi:hypothetical protein